MARDDLSLSRVFSLTHPLSLFLFRERCTYTCTRSRRGFSRRARFDDARLRLFARHRRAAIPYLRIPRASDFRPGNFSTGVRGRSRHYACEGDISSPVWWFVCIFFFFSSPQFFRGFHSFRGFLNGFLAFGACTCGCDVVD